MTQPVLRILGRAASINVRKLLWTCVELELPFVREDVDTSSPELRALNPNGLVPVLIDGDFVLWESNSICRYLAARQRREDLLPQEPRARARVEQWMDWQAGELNNSWRYAFMGLVRGSASHQDAGLQAESVANWNRHMGMLEAQLARGGPFVLGASFTLADVVLGLSVQRWMSTGMHKPALPAVHGYYECLSERPGFIVHGRNGLP
jgi:glutathione S-transferase